MTVRMSLPVLLLAVLALGSCSAPRQAVVSAGESAKRTEDVTWNAAAKSIADPAECPLYRGLRIRPQLGLTPWRRNPVSGLWEFLLDDTGLAPATDAYGRIESKPTDAVILVLIPGGHDSGPATEAAMGIPAAPTFSFFLATHELSIRQSRALTGSEAPEVDRDGASPYVFVSWDEADLMLKFRGLRLPTEAEWQFAATAFEGSGWWTKLSRDDQCAYVNGNLADATLRQSYSLFIDHEQGAFDGEALVASCGRYGPGGAGFYDLAGNVEEWVAGEDRSGEAKAEKVRITKGGSFLSLIDSCRPESRGLHGSRERAGTIGLRVARSLQ